MKYRLILGALAFLLTAYGAASWWAAGLLAMPPRKVLTPLQLDDLARVKERGMQVLARTTSHGTPYLDCRPIPGAHPAQRGSTLRAQMTQMRIPLAPFGQVNATLVLLHGWGMRKENLLFVAERFCAAGFRCLIPDLPGHGENPWPFTHFGSTPEERHLPAEVYADAAPGAEAAKPSLWGMSMGGAWAIEAAAAEPERWGAVVSVCPFDALGPVAFAKAAAATGQWTAALQSGVILSAQMRCGLWLPGVRPVDAARTLTVPALVVHGTADDLIPLAAGRRLFEAVAASRKRWLEVTDARHGNVLATPQHVYVEMAAWLLQPTPPASTRLTRW